MNTQILKIIFDTHKFDFPVDTYEIRRSTFTGKLMVKMKSIDGQVKIMSEDEYIPNIQPNYFEELKSLIK